MIPVYNHKNSKYYIFTQKNCLYLVGNLHEYELGQALPLQQISQEKIWAGMATKGTLLIT